MIEEKDRESRAWHEHWWRFIPLVLWVGVILFSSTGNASMSRTSRFLRPLLELFFSSENTIHWANVIIRKIAHLTNYSILAGFASFAFLGSSIQPLRNHWFRSSLILVFLTASLDEIHQSFDPSRIGSASDVLLDCIGGIAMLIFVRYLISYYPNKG